MIGIPAFPAPLAFALLGFPAVPFVVFGLYLALFDTDHRSVSVAMMLYGLLMIWAMASLLVAA